MSLRATLAALIAVLLLSMPYAASTCQACCAIQAGGAHCDGAARDGHPAEQEMAGMSDCGMSKAAPAGEFKTSGCVHFNYEQQAAAVKDEQTAEVMRTVPSQWDVAMFSVAALPGAAALKQPVAFTTEKPPRRTPLLASLQTCIRV